MSGTRNLEVVVAVVVVVGAGTAAAAAAALVVRLWGTESAVVGQPP